MKKVKFTALFLTILMSLVLFSCGDKDESVTPTPTVPDYVGSWSCTTSNPDDAFSFTISNISGKAWVTSFNLEVKYQDSVNGATNNQNPTFSSGIVEVKNDAFTLTSSNFNEVDDNSVLKCEFSSGSKAAGSYTIIWSPLGGSQSFTVTGTYTATLNE